MRFKLGVVATHPIQYQAPWFRALAADPQIDLEVLFGHRATAQDQSDAGFGIQFEWDTPVLEGYRHEFVPNVAAQPGPGRFSGIDTPAIGRLIIERRYDAVFLSCGWYFKSAWQSMLACWRAGIPVIVRGDSHLRTPRSSYRKAAKTLAYRWLIPRFDACLYASAWSREYFLHYGARKEKVFFAPHALDEARFARDLANQSVQRPQFRERWQLDPDAVVFLFSGKFLANKRPLDFIRAVAQAAGGNRHIQGLMVGDGPMRGQCETLVRETGAPVRFTGFLNQSQIVDSYVAADVLVLPSEAETWGLVAQEAMFCSLPCIVSDQAGCGPDLVVSGVTGDIFPYGKVDSLAQLMARYASATGRLSAMGKSAREQIARYSLSAAVNGVLQALETVTGSPALTGLPARSTK